MPSSNPFPEQQVDPLAPIEHLAHWLLDSGVHCALGLMIGAIAARLMRSRHLHWSWAAAALALVVLARGSLGGSSSMLAVASITAVGRGRGWHREDLDAGGDLADLAARRRTPTDVLHRCLRFTLRRGHRALGAERRPRRGELVLGRDERRRSVSIPFEHGGGGRHTLVLGATGSGKTVTQAWMAVQAIQRGMGAVVIDPKGDPAMREHVRRAVQAAGRPFLEWTPDGNCIYNPYARGSETEIADKILAGERFTEPHYLRQSQRYLGHVVRALRRRGSEVSLEQIVEHLDPVQLELLVRELPESEAQATHAYLDSLTARQQSDLAGVRDRLAILTESDIGRWLDPRTVGGHRFDLLAAVRARAVVYFSLESDSRPLLTQMLGAAIVQDLQTIVAALQGRPVPTLVTIDEFSAVAAEQVVRLFGRARSAGFSLLLGTQEVSDLRLPGRERLLEQVIGNLSVLIAHRQVVPASAELVANLAGSTGAWKVSRHSDGRTTRTRIREAVLEPSELMGLGQGWGVVMVLDRGGQPQIARMYSPHQPR
jgi:type IV secretion system coupling TraD/TrwB family protein